MSRTAIWRAPRPSWGLLEMKAAGASLLRMYAGIFFSSSLPVGALVLLATALDPACGLFGLLAVATATATARLLGLVSDASPTSTFAYNALFVGLGASRTFASFEAALALATLGSAASAVVTAAMGGWLQRFELPALSLPFTLVYCCALSLGATLGVEWAQPGPYSEVNTLPWPVPVRVFLEALGGLLFLPRIDVGLVVFASLCLRGGHAAQLALLAFGVTALADLAVALEPQGLWLGALINAIFSAIVLGAGWYAPSAWSYPRAAFGALLSILLTLALASPLGSVGLTPVSLPFNLSIFAVLLIGRHRHAITTPSPRHPSTAAALADGST